MGAHAFIFIPLPFTTPPHAPTLHIHTYAYNPTPHYKTITQITPPPHFNHTPPIIHIHHCPLPYPTYPHSPLLRPSYISLTPPLQGSGPSSSATLTPQGGSIHRPSSSPRHPCTSTAAGLRPLPLPLVQHRQLHLHLCSNKENAAVAASELLPASATSNTASPAAAAPARARQLLSPRYQRSSKLPTSKTPPPAHDREEERVGETEQRE